jgi:GNAT superfamily N-acetyltransferase
MTVSVDALLASDVEASSRLHAEVLHMEFLARCGERFLRTYHRAWIASDEGVALAAHDDSGELVGVLLGALRPELHFRAMVRRSGLALGFWLLVRAASHPTFARELVATRGARYVRGLTRIGLAALRRSVRGIGSLFGKSSGARVTERGSRGAVGEVTHVMVHPASQGKGVGRALLDQVASLGRAADLAELVLVTPPDLDAAGFYDRLGWKRAGSIASRSGESFVRFRLPLKE